MFEIIEAISGFMVGKEAARSKVRIFKISLVVTIVFFLGLIVQDILVLKNKIDLSFFFIAIPAAAIVFLVSYILLSIAKKKIKKTKNKFSNFPVDQ